MKIYPKKDKKIVVWDLETYSTDELVNNTKPYALGLLVDGVYEEIWDSDSDKIFSKFMSKLRKIKTEGSIYCYAHNASRFDNVLLVEFLYKRHFNFKPLYKDNCVLGLSVFKRGFPTIHFRDTYKILASSLDKLCKAFKLSEDDSKGVFDHDKVKCYDDALKFKHEISPYLEKDVRSLEIIINKVDKTLKKYLDMEITDSMTSAGLSRNFFFKGFYKSKKFPLYKLDTKFDISLRKDYFGGRVDLYEKVGVFTDEMRYIDACSFYPSIMLKNEFPYGIKKIVKKSIEEIYDDDKHTYFVHVYIDDIGSDKIPFLGHKIGGKLCFPRYDKKTLKWITGKEIRFMIDNDLGYNFHEIEECVQYKQAPIFKECVKELFKVKTFATDQNNKPLRDMAKVCINSLYGFWGIRTDSLSKVEHLHRRHKDFLLRSDRVIGFKDLGQKRFAVNYLGGIDVNYSVLSLAFMITSLCRMELYDVMNFVKSKGGKVIYSDTDSIMTTGYDFQKDEEFIKRYDFESEKLGSWGSEIKCGLGCGSYSEETVILGCKMYGYRCHKCKTEIIKLKGLPARNKYKIVIDDDKKTIELHGGGGSKLKLKHLKMLLDGYIIVEKDHLSFQSSQRSCITDYKGLTKKYITKSFRMYYDKGKLDKELKISPLSI